MSAIPDSTTTHQILYAPFSKDYHVSEDIAEKLTEQQFFTHCYVKPDFEGEAKRISDSTKAEDGDYIDEADDGSPFLVEYELIDQKRKLLDYKTSYAAFIKWIHDSGNGVYCIKGDAGTGKTTFLHNLEYQSRNKRIVWEILDLQAALERIKVYSQEIVIRNFGKLNRKVISSLLVKIISVYFPLRSTVTDILEHLDYLYYCYLNNKVVLFQTEEVKWFFDDASIFQAGNQTEAAVEKFIIELCEKLQALIDSKPEDIVIDRLLDIYMTFLRSENPYVKYLIAFDNIERFIKNDEIFNSQIDSFVEELRHLSDSYLQRDGDFLRRFQFIILMRNTSSRMSNIPLQLIDFGGHDLDLTGWFPVDLIISNKINWYSDNGFTLQNGEIIDSIIGMNSFDGHGIRSLHKKLGSILNQDKRIIVNMLDRALGYAKATNPIILERYKYLIDQERNIPRSLIRFAARSIIIRLILDVFREDSFFKLIRTQEKGTKFERLGYSRSILSILYEYYLENNQRILYMPFDNLISQLVGESYFDYNNHRLRETISSILFTMNYYNRRTNDWFHLIDIQYNLPSGSKNVSDAAELDKLLCEHPSETGLRIMEAGIGYLKYIVQSFEYFSCRYEKEYLPPLLCLTPTKTELDSKSVTQFECYKVIIKVQKEAYKCMDYMKKNGSAGFPFRKRETEKGILHIDRIINSHTGYISNFMDFVNEYYKKSELTDNEERKLNTLFDKLRTIIAAYNARSTQE